MQQYGIDNNELRKIKSAIASMKGVDKAILYGSRAKGCHKPFSDVDISLVGKNLSINDLLHLHTVIDDMLLPYEIDINIFDRITNEKLREHILRCGIEL
ncbi:MAG: nucleotidyltransferase family protein [Prevotella sp.]